MVCLWTFKGERTLTIRKIWGRQRSKSAFKDSRLPVLGWTIWLNYLWLCLTIKYKWETQSIQSQKTIYNPCNWFSWLSCSFVCLFTSKEKRFPQQNTNRCFVGQIQSRKEKKSWTIYCQTDRTSDLCYMCVLFV
jgi:hypothetical protein